MTRSELVTRIAARFPQLTQKDATVAVDLILESIEAALNTGRRAEIRNFGSFSVHCRPPRRGRNPKTGESVTVPAKHVPYFKPGKGLLDRLQAGQSRKTEPTSRRPGENAAAAIAPRR